MSTVKYFKDIVMFVSMMDFLVLECHSFARYLRLKVYSKSTFLDSVPVASALRTSTLLRNSTWTRALQSCFLSSKLGSNISARSGLAQAN